MPHILVVDDEATLREIARRALEVVGHRVTVATAAEEALAILAVGGGVDLVFTDVQLPGLSGIELASQIRARWPDVRVLLTSGGGLDPQLLAGHVFLGKPYAPADLQSMVAAELDRS